MHMIATVCLRTVAVVTHVVRGGTLTNQAGKVTTYTSRKPSCLGTKPLTYMFVKLFVPRPQLAPSGLTVKLGGMCLLKERDPRRCVSTLKLSLVPRHNLGATRTR